MAADPRPRPAGGSANTTVQTRAPAATPRAGDIAQPRWLSRLHLGFPARTVFPLRCMSLGDRQRSRAKPQRGRLLCCQWASATAPGMKSLSIPQLCIQAGCSLPLGSVQAQLSPAGDPGSSWGQPWTRGDTPLSCKNTFAQRGCGYEPAAAEATNRPVQVFTTNTLPVQVEAKPDRTDRTWGARNTRCRCCGAAGGHHGRRGAAQPSRHAGSPDPTTGKPPRKELPRQFAAWAARMTDRPEEQEGERLNSPFMQTARLLLQIPCPRPQGCAQVHQLPPAPAVGARAGRGQLQFAQAICQAAAKWNWEGTGFAISAPPPRAALKPGMAHGEQAYLTTSHIGASSAPGRSHNISPEWWRGDLSLPQVPEQIRCGAMQNKKKKGKTHSK